MGDDVATRLARLETVIDTLRAEVDELRAENAGLRAGAAPTSEERGTTPPVSASMGRRRLLVGGATAGAAAVAGVVATGQPAVAANGGNLILGQTNEGAGETKLVYQGSGNNGFRVEGTSTLALIEGFQGGSGPGFKGANTAGGPGVNGVANTGAGVHGESTDGAGVTGASTNSIGVVGNSDNGGFGIFGFSPRDVGVGGESGEGTGVEGFSVSGLGVSGVSNIGVGAAGQSNRGTGLRGETMTGTAVLAQATSGIGLISSSSRANLALQPGTRTTPPTADAIAHARGEVVIDNTGAVWLCIAAGTPGTWRKLGGPSTAGQLHVLPAPARVYDSRPGTAPTNVGPKTKFAPNEVRTLDLKVNNSSVPAGATAALVTILLVNAAATNANATIWANGVAKPLANTMVWGGATGRFTATATTALDSQARVRFHSSATTDLVLDVVGYYR